MAHDEDVQHTENLITTKSRRLRELEAQKARFGLHTPPHITMEIEDISGELPQLRERLRRLREKPAGAGETRAAPVAGSAAPTPGSGLTKWLPIAGAVIGLVLVAAVGYGLAAGGIGFGPEPLPVDPAGSGAAPAAIVPPTATPTEPMPETGLNIAVAEFTSVTGDPLLKPDDGFNLQQALVAAMEAVRADLPAVLRTGEVRAVAAVSATDPALREAEVAQLAETLNATIVLYGSITPQENGVYRVDPQFYIPPDAAGFAGFDEVVGPTELGGPVQFKPPLNQPSLATLNAELNTRIEALKSIVEGLALLDAARTDEAYQRFETARNALESADYSSGLEVIQLMLGAVKLSQYRTASGLDLTIPADAAAAAPLLAQAETDFGRGLLFDPGYARLFLGLGAVALAQTNQQLFAAGVAPEAVQSRIVDARDWYSRALPVQTEQSPRGYVAIKARFGVAQTYLAEYQHAIQQYNQALKAQDNAGRETAATTAVAAREKAGENLQQVVSAYREAGQPGRLALLAGQAQALLGKLAFDEAFYWQATGQPEQAALLFAQVAVECNAAQAILEQPDLAKNLVALNLRARCFDWQAVANLNSATANPATARSVCDAAHRLGVLSGALAEESLLCLKLLENSSIPAGQE